jgi:protein-S-isoprenylcysteine O-methyltransferase Ste14
MTVKDDTDRPNRHPWPPIIYVAALAAAFVLDRLVPLWPGTFDPQLYHADLALILAGLAVAFSGFFYFQFIGTPFDPTGQAKVLATGGIYRVTRNPMYVGALIFFVGFALASGSGWLLAGVPGIAFALRKLAIEPEEAYLTRRFGEDYITYCGRVRRWI